MPDRGSALARCGRRTHDPLLGSTRCAGGLADRGAPRPPQPDSRPHRPTPMKMPPASAVPRRASLPMYDFPELRPAHAALWNAIAENLAKAGLDGIPDLLTFDGEPAALWQAPDL